MIIPPLFINMATNNIYWIPWTITKQSNSGKHKLILYYKNQLQTARETNTLQTFYVRSYIYIPERYIKVLRYYLSNHMDELKQKYKYIRQSFRVYQTDMFYILWHDTRKPR
jgi:hypothetical protein